MYYIQTTQEEIFAVFGERRGSLGATELAVFDTASEARAFFSGFSEGSGIEFYRPVYELDQWGMDARGDCISSPYGSEELTKTKMRERKREIKSGDHWSLKE